MYNVHVLLVIYDEKYNYYKEKGATMIKVSIIVPIYNVEKYINKCLDSLTNQTLKEIEIICINDGSTDNSLKLLENYKNKDSRIVLINQKNSGQSAARNKGVEIAKGEYIGFVDSDDWIDSNFFERLYESAKRTDSDIATAGIYSCHSFNKRKFLSFDKEIVTSDKNLKFEFCDIPEKSYCWNKIYRNTSLKNSGIKFEEGIIFEDCIYTPQVIYFLEQMVTVPDIYYYYRRRVNSTVKQRDKKANKDSIYAHKKAGEFITEHNIDISSHEPKTYRFKIFGISIFKIRQKGKNKQYSLFNIIKFGKL